MLHVGFRHENDEFVAAIASDDIGAAAIRFKNMADALENEIAFEVAVEIVDELKAVEVHKDEGERAACAGGSFPLGRKGFHKKAMGLDTGEAVRDGLLLGFLEREGVVQCAGNEVGKST